MDEALKVISPASKVFFLFGDIHSIVESLKKDSAIQSRKNYEVYISVFKNDILHSSVKRYIIDKNEFINRLSNIVLSQYKEEEMKVRTFLNTGFIDSAMSILHFKDVNEAVDVLGDLLNMNDSGEVIIEPQRDVYEGDNIYVYSLFYSVNNSKKFIAYIVNNANINLQIVDFSAPGSFSKTIVTDKLICDKLFDYIFDAFGSEAIHIIVDKNSFLKDYIEAIGGVRDKFMTEAIDEYRKEVPGGSEYVNSVVYFVVRAVAQRTDYLN